jgi:hypothetical protein
VVHGSQFMVFLLNPTRRKLIFCRLLSTYDWYTLIKLIPKKLLREALTDDVLGRLYPKELKEKYKYAREILFK